MRRCDKFFSESRPFFSLLSRHRVGPRSRYFDTLAERRRERERESCLRDFIDRGCESPRHRSLGLSPCRRERVHEERRTVAVEPRVSLACNRIAMLILSRPRGYVERERPACLVRIRDESEFQFQLRGRRRRAEPRLARCPFPALIPFIAN